MVDRLSDRPFTLLGINSDAMSRSALQKRFKKERITWPNLFEGTGRKISRRWNIRAYPTIFILDHEGVIRARGFLGAEAIEKKVKELLKKVPASA